MNDQNHMHEPAKPDIATRVKTLLAEELGQPLARVTDAAVLDDDLGADSLDRVEIAMALEDEFAIVIPDDGIEDPMRTVADVVAYVTKRVQ